VVEGVAAKVPLDWLRLSLLWSLGIDLRLTVLAVPPVLPLIHHDLHLDEKMVAALTGLPVMLFGMAAVPGSLLIARRGARRAVIAGALMVAASSALRGLGPSVLMLFAMSVVMGFGVAIMQPALPTLVSQWFAARVPLATAVYVNGLLIGETVAASLTFPFVLPIGGGSWEATFVIWSLPVLITAILVALFAPQPEARTSDLELQWWPDWRDARTWQLGLIGGGASALYFGSNALLPDYLHAIGRPDLVAPTLTALNASQLPASVLIMLFGGRLAGKRWPYIVAALLGFASLAGLLVPTTPTIIASVAVIGFAAASVLILTLALPPLLARAKDVHRLAAGMLALSYSLTFLIPYIGGSVWDATRISAAALLPGAVGALIVLVLAPTLRLPEAR
jgi:CP family cyanate transporter-like MFS transporter